MHRFEALKIWQKATEDFPSEKKYGLVSQSRRSAVSIPPNIAEDAGRNTNGEFKQFLGIANGSSFALLTQLYILKRLNLIKEKSVRPIINEVFKVTKMNYSLQKSLNKS